MGKRGFIYVTALGAVIILTMASASLLMRGVSETSLSERSRSQSEAIHLADAGVDQAGRNLRTPTDLTDDIVTGALSTGTFQLEGSLVQLGAQTWQTVSRGTSVHDSGLPRRVEATFQLVAKSVFEFALFGDQKVEVSGSAFTDSYDSRSGAYDPNNHGHNGDVGTNSTASGGVAFTGDNLFIDGQVAVGPDVSDPTSIVTNFDPLLVTGGTSPPSDYQDVVSQADPFPMPPVSVPDGMSCDNDKIISGSGETLPPGTYCYHNLTVQGNATFTASGPVTIYLTGRLTAQGNSTIGVATSPKTMAFLMTSTAQATLEEGTITGSTLFYGAIYGPDAVITIQGNAEVFGSIIAERVNVTGDAQIHYDEALTERTDISNLYKASLISWRDLE